MRTMDMNLSINLLEQKLAERYEPICMGKRKCFRLTDGRIIALDRISAFNAIVVEYAENMNAAKLNQFEDGDCFSLEQYHTATLLKVIFDEIES